MSNEQSEILWQNKEGTVAEWLMDGISVWLMDGTNLIGAAAIGFNPGSNWHVIPQHQDLV